MNNFNFTIRKATTNDLQASYDIRKNALGDYVKQTWGWDETWQWDYHIKDFNPDIMNIIEIDGKPIGTLEVEYEKGAIVVNGIYLIDKFQSQGIGQEMMECVIIAASEEKKPVKLQVLKVNNRAKEFYLRMGFNVYAENETHYKMIYYTE